MPDAPAPQSALLEIAALHEFEGGVIGCWSRGHHDAATFVLAAHNYGNDYVTKERVRTAWWRHVPVSGGRGTTLHDAKPKSPGAFPVTFAENGNAH